MYIMQFGLYNMMVWTYFVIGVFLQSGATVGWRVDASGNLQTVFTHELKDPLVQVVYRVHTNTDKNIPTLDIK